MPACRLPPKSYDGERGRSTDLFQRLDLMERRGSGFGKIIDAYAWESEKRGRVLKPTFSSNSMGFTMVLPNLNYGISINGLKIPSASGDRQETLLESPLKTLLKSPLKKTDRTLVELIAKTPTATISMMQQKAGITRDGVNKALKRLKTSGIIRRVGPDKGGHWELVSPPQPRRT